MDIKRNSIRQMNDSLIQVSHPLRFNNGHKSKKTSILDASQLVRIPIHDKQVEIQ